ncbi:MAG: SRPBCC family protein [Bdellovibrionota bacterium]
MKTFILGLVFVFLSIFAVGFGFIFYGRTLPEAHHAELILDLHATPNRIWTLITDYSKMPEWLSEVKKVEEEKTTDGKTITWMTDSHRQRLPFVTEEIIPEKRLVRKILEQQSFFGGTWTFELEPVSPTVTRFTIKEDGFIRPPLFRVMMKFSGGPEKSLHGFVGSLVQRLKKP